MEVNIERLEFARGASTITQQLAKNLYLSPSKNPIRKMRELLIARRLEAELTKQRILELYLNVIEWGDGIYGAEAAARTLLRQVRGRARAPGGGAARGGHGQPATAESGRPTARLRRRQQMIMRRMGAVRPAAGRGGVPAASRAARARRSGPCRARAGPAGAGASGRAARGAGAPGATAARRSPARSPLAAKSLIALPFDVILFTLTILPESAYSRHRFLLHTAPSLEAARTRAGQRQLCCRFGVSR